MTRSIWTIALLLVMVTGCSTPRPTITPTQVPPLITAAEAAAVIKTWFARSNNTTCQNLSRRTDTWQAQYEGRGAWLVSFGTHQWRVFERTSSFEVVQSTLRC